MDQILQWLAQWIAAFLQTMGQGVFTLIQSVTTWLGQIVTTITNYFATVFQTLAAALQQIVSAVANILQGWVTAIQTLVSQIIERVVGLVTAAFDRVVAYVVAAWDALVDFIEGAASRIGEFVSGLVESIQGFVQSVLDAVAGAVGTVIDAIEAAIAELVSVAEQTLAAARQRIEQGWQQLITGAEAIILSVNARIGDLAAAFQQATTDLIAGMTGIAGDLLEPFVQPFQAIIGDLLQWASPPETTALLQQIQKIVNGQAAFTDVRDFAAWGWRALAPQRGVWKGIFTVVMVAAAAIPLVMRVSQASAEVMMQEFGSNLPYQILSPGDVSAAYRRGFIGEDAAIETIRKQGFKIADAWTILHLSEQVPDLDVMLTLLNRGDVSAGEVVNGIRQRGFDEPWVGGLLRLKDQIPPVADLITMAVREAFTPEVAQQFGQYEDFPEAIVPWLAKQGIDQEWARRYWAAHWGLPSATQGFDMLHRGIIDHGQLELLLRAQDVMPFWREKLIQLSYHVLTRVDARRMHQLGVLDDDGLLEAHKRMGYSPADAANLTEFVKRLNAHAPGEDDEELGRLSRAQILNFYQDGALTKERAAVLLQQLGHTAEAAELLLSNVDLDEERRERHALRDLILEKAEAGLITFEDAQDQLGRIGLETNEVQRALTKLLRSEQRRTKLPTKEDAVRFVRAGLLDLNGYQELLGRLGYAPRWVELYVRLERQAQQNG